MPGLTLNRPDRRGFLKVGAALSGGLVIKLTVPISFRPPWAAEAGASFNPNAFIQIDREGVVTLVRKKEPQGWRLWLSPSMWSSSILKHCFLSIDCSPESLQRKADDSSK